MSFSRIIKTTALTATLAVLASCNGGGGGGGGTVGSSTGGGTTGSTYGSYSSAFVSVDSFVAALNNLESTNYQSYVELYADETLRSATPGEEDWFVIYDDRYNEHKAVSLQYIRAIVYYDYYSNTTALAQEFRGIENDDILNGDLFGD